MARNLINKYLWIVDVLRRYKALTLSQISDMWLRNDVDDGRPLARRTFMTYRNSIEEMFNINIVCNKTTYEYYIEDNNEMGNTHLEWMLDSMSISGTLQNSQSVAGRIMVESVPSARHHLPIVVDALKQNLCIKFSYKSYTRAGLSTGIVIRPYFVKIFKQVWYVIGYNIKDEKIKTY
ncbi:MAG: WYL domain-containing protein, partial [Bacteroidales bacterium]|nr:WYL domain-containing protein [Candidatus Sodaliphilus fimicaballi]